MPAGMHSVLWDGRDNNNAVVASGVYFYRLSSINNVQTKRMLLMK
jgi:flagellar hook assembly protein FlgD